MLRKCNRMHSLYLKIQTHPHLGRDMHFLSTFHSPCGLRLLDPPKMFAARTNVNLLPTRLLNCHARPSSLVSVINWQHRHRPVVTVTSTKCRRHLWWLRPNSQPDDILYCTVQQRSLLCPVPYRLYAITPTSTSFVKLPFSCLLLCKSVNNTGRIHAA